MMPPPARQDPTGAWLRLRAQNTTYARRLQHFCIWPLTLTPNYYANMNKEPTYKS